MSELYMMVTITNRQLTRKFVECYKEKGAQVGSVTVGMGTAANEILDYFGLDGMEKSVLFHLVTDAAWRQIKAALRKKMQIDLPGMGIAFIIPVSSVGGKKALNYEKNYSYFNCSFVPVRMQSGRASPADHSGDN